MILEFVTLYLENFFDAIMYLSPKRMYYLSLMGVVILSLIVVSGLAVAVIFVFMDLSSKNIKLPLFIGVVLIYGIFRYTCPRLKKRYLGTEEEKKDKK